MTSKPQSNNAKISTPLDLLTTGRWSDLILRCDGEDFYVHRSWVCMRSQTLFAASEGNFTEGETGIIEVTIIDKATLKRMLTYIYTGDYDDGTVSKTEETEQTDKVSDSSVSASADGEDEGPPRSPRNNNTTASTPAYNLPTTNGILITNTRVCVAAEYYEIPALKTLAVQQFQSASASVKWQQLGFGAVVNAVYQELPEGSSPLRTRVCQMATEHAGALRQDAEFMVSAMHIAEFAADFVRSLVESHELQIAAYLHTISNIYRKHELETRQFETEKQTYEATKKKLAAGVNTIKFINDTTQCRHCSIPFSTTVDTTESLGKWQVRCRECRTRHG